MREILYPEKCPRGPSQCFYRTTGAIVDAEIWRIKETYRAVKAGLPWSLPKSLAKDLVALDDYDSDFEDDDDDEADETTDQPAPTR